MALEGGIAGGASDGNFTGQITATLDGLVTVGDGAYAAHEHILINETLNRGTLLTLLIASPDISK